MEVIHAPGQYGGKRAATCEAYEWVKQETTDYLRGRVETGMPSNVVFQAGFKQGNYTWLYMESSGHYFCGWK